METTIEKPIEEKATPGSGERLIQRVGKSSAIPILLDKPFFQGYTLFTK